MAYTPKVGASGSATLEVIARDSGGTANGGVDRSMARVFTITIVPEYRNYLAFLVR